MTKHGSRGGIRKAGQGALKGGHAERVPFIKSHARARARTINARRIRKVKIVINADAKMAVKNLVKASQNWGPTKNAIFAAEFIKVAQKHGLNAGELAGATLRRVDPDEHKKLIAVMKLLSSGRQRSQ